MNIHEYQAKALLRSYGAPVSDGRVVLKAEDAKTAAGEMDAVSGDKTAFLQNFEGFQAIIGQSCTEKTFTCLI